MSTTDLLKLQKELEERERVLAERAKQQEHQLTMESQQLTKVRAEFEAASRREEPRGAIVKGMVGNMSEFSLKEDWTRWFERLTYYFSGNNVTKEKQISLFITLVKIMNFSLQLMHTEKAGKSHNGASYENAKSPAIATKCNIAAL